MRPQWRVLATVWQPGTRDMLRRQPPAAHFAVSSLWEDLGTRASPNWWRPENLNHGKIWQVWDWENLMNQCLMVFSPAWLDFCLSLSPSRASCSWTAKLLWICWNTWFLVGDSTFRCFEAASALGCHLTFSCFCPLKSSKITSLQLFVYLVVLKKQHRSLVKSSFERIWKAKCKISCN